MRLNVCKCAYFFFWEIKSFRRPFRAPFQCSHTGSVDQCLLDENGGPQMLVSLTHFGTVLKIRTIERHSLCGSGRMLSRLYSLDFKLETKELQTNYKVNIRYKQRPHFIIPSAHNIYQQKWQRRRMAI